MSKKNQQGSAHLIVIIVLVTVILGLLGFVFYQNFIQQPKQITENSKTNEPSITPVVTDPKLVELSEIATDTTTDSGLAIKYPKTWTLSNNKEPFNGMTRDDTSITSPDGKVIVNYNVLLIGGIGGDCRLTEDGTKVLQMTQLNSDVIPGYQSARYIDYVEHNTLDNSYRYFIGAQLISDFVLSVKAGDMTDRCQFFGSSIPVDKNSGEMIRPVLSLNIVLNDISDKSSSLSDINNAMKTDNFIVAKRIVQSLYVK